MTGVLIWTGAIIAFVCVVVVLAACRMARPTPEEREQEDLAQARYLADWHAARRK